MASVDVDLLPFVARLNTNLISSACCNGHGFCIIVYLPLAAQSSPDVTDVPGVDDTPLGMYVQLLNM